MKKHIIKTTHKLTGASAALMLLTATQAQALSLNEMKAHVQVAFMWTQERQNNYGGKSQVISNMRQSWGITNRALDNSDCGVQTSYVPRDTAVNYNANSGNFSIIGDLRDGRVPGAYGWRDQSGCDVMALNGQMSAAGLAWGGDPRQYAVKFLTGPASAHELGHTFGLGHGGVGSSYSDGTGDTGYAGGWAHQYSNGRKGTTMTGAQIMWYSTPNKTFQGVVTGIPNVKDSTRRIIETRLESSRIRNIIPQGGRASGWWYIRNRWSNHYMGLASGNSNNGTRITQRHGRNSYAQWRFDDAQIGGGWLTSRNRGSGKAMGMSGVAADGRFCHQWDLQGVGTQYAVNQHIKLDHQDDGFVRIRFRNGNRVAANSGFNAGDNNPVVQWPWVGYSILQWYLEREH